MSKIVFFDIDGTLLDETGTMIPSAEQAIRKLKSNGIIPAIATGRSPFGFREFRDSIDPSLFELYIYCNGSKIEYEGNTIYDQHIDPQEVEDIIQRAKELGIPYGVTNSDCWRFSQQNIPDVSLIFGHMLAGRTDLCDPEHYRSGPIYAGCLFCGPEKAPLFQDVAKQCEVVRGMVIGGELGPQLDFWREDINKATSILKAIELLGIPLENTFAFGDGSNDVQMMKTVGFGVAMGNATDEVKQAAKFVTRHILEDGIQYGLEYLNLI